MEILATFLVAVVAASHILFLILEMFLWDRPLGRRTFGLSADDAATTKVLAANQGLYNGFLAAGLIWGLLRDNVEVQIFFLACVVMAGLFGGMTVSRRIVLVQAFPAAIALVLVLLEV